MRAALENYQITQIFTILISVLQAQRHEPKTKETKSGK